MIVFEYHRPDFEIDYIRTPPVKAVWRRAGRDAVLVRSPYERG